MTRTDSSWLSDNLFVVAALALPLIVIAFFLLATGIPRLLVDDPQYDMLYVVNRYEDKQLAMRFRVVDGRLVADARLSNSVATWQNQTLYRFDADTLSVKRIRPAVPESVIQKLHNKTAAERSEAKPLVAPAPVATHASETFEVAETASLQLLPDPIAPDGYEFRSEFAGNRGLFGDLFGMGSRRSGVSIAQRGRVIPLPMSEEAAYYYYSNARLLGWIAR